MDLNTVVGKCKSQGISEIVVNQEAIDYFAKAPGRSYIMYNGVKVWSELADKNQIESEENQPAFKKLFK